MTVDSVDANAPDAVQTWIRLGAPAQELQGLLTNIRRGVDAEPSCATRIRQSLDAAAKDGTVDARLLRCVVAELTSATLTREFANDIHLRDSSAPNGLHRDDGGHHVADAAGPIAGPDATRFRSDAYFHREPDPTPAVNGDEAETPHFAPRMPATLNGPGKAGTGSSWTPRRRSDTAAAREVTVGTVLNGHYRLDARIGAGGMGEVWRARDLIREYTQDPRPDIAVKLLKQDFESHPDSFVSLSREASRTLRLAHPNILTVHDFALDAESGRAFMTMELLEGESLDRVIARHASGLPRERALPIIRELATGLAFAHRKGYVHCDLKPANVFLQPDEAPKILDFGISRLSRLAAADLRADSFDAGRLGALSPPYATIEIVQATAESGPDPTDDVYALGLIAYELLTGKHPYQRRSGAEALERTLVAARIAGISGRQNRAIHRAIALRRADRWPDAESFRQALEGWNAKLVAAATASALLAVVAGTFGYEAYRAAQPVLPFESLPAESRSNFTTAVGEGRRLLEFSARVRGFEGAYTAQAALSKFAEAYQVHPRNPDADQGLRDTLERLEPFADSNDRAVRANLLDTLRKALDEHDALKGFRPLEKLIEKLQDSPN